MDKPESASPDSIVSDKSCGASLHHVHLACSLLAACGTNPAALGITGAPMPEPPPDPGETQTGIPGAPESERRSRRAARKYRCR